MPRYGNVLATCKHRAFPIALRLVLLPVLFPAEHAAPAGIDNDGRSGTEIHPLAGAFHGQRLFLAGWGKGFQHPAGYQGIDGRFRLGQFLRHDTRDNQGMMVGHFRVVHASGIQAGKVKSVPVFPELGHSHDFLQQDRNMRHDIFGYVSASRPRIGNQFLLIQRLGDGKGLVRRQVVVDVAVLLECGQVVEKRGLLECPLAFRLGDCRNGFGRYFPVCRLCRSLLLELLRVDELPVRLSLLQRDVQLPIGSGNEVAVLLEACAYHGECRGLYPPDGVVRRTGGYRQRAAGIHAHQPVRLCPAVRCGIETVITASVLEVCHAFADGLVRERGDPQPSERLGITQIGIYPPEDKFPFTACIRCHDDVVALGEHLVDDLQLPGGGNVRHHPPVRPDLSGYQPERVRHHREVFGNSLCVAVCVGQCQRHEVSRRPCDHVPVACTVAVLFFRCADHAGYVHAHTLFFCYDCFHVRIKFKPFPVTGTGKQETAV